LIPAQCTVIISGGEKLSAVKTQKKKKINKKNNASSNKGNRSSGSKSKKSIGANVKKSTKEGSSNHTKEIQGILFLAFGILMMLSFYIKDSIGLFGEFIREVSLGMFGFPAFLIPPVIVFYSAFLIFTSDGTEFKKKPLYILILFLLVSALVQAGQYGPESFSGYKPLDVLRKFYSDGVDLAGGGVLGGLLSLPFLATFKALGTIVIITALALIDIILLTNSSIAGFIKNVQKMFVARQHSTKTAIKAKRKLDDPENDDFYGTVIDNSGELSLRFDKKPKIIDFKVEKAAQEHKHKDEDSDNIMAPEPIPEVPESLMPEPDEEQNEEALGLIINDFNNKKKEKPSRPKAKHEMAEENKAADKNDAEPNKMIVKAPDGTDIVKKQYVYPPYELLIEDDDTAQDSKNIRSLVIDGAKKLEETLASFGVSAKVINVTHGPTVTRYELQPSAGVKVSRIVNLSDDIALNLAAPGIRIEAPIPGKAAIGIEVPNKEVNMVRIRDVIESREFSQHPSRVSFAVGKDVSGDIIVADIAKMPHLLIAGATGSGKSVCINSLIVSLLYKASPEEVKLLMIDPKVVELGIYNGIPHLLIPVVTEPKKAAGALNWAVQEMVNRYKTFADKQVRDIKGYNELVSKTGEGQPMPQIVIIIDELADLMMVAPNDVEDAICRLAQMARAAGMHLVIATQRPSVDVITGVIKANIPSRISFAVSSQIDSRTILDMAGAEKLLGRGDMLLHPVGKPKPVRVQGACITDAEVEKVVDFVKAQGEALYNDDIIEEINSDDTPVDNNDSDADELLPKAIELVIDAGQASVSLIQRKFKVGYARAARIVDQMEERGIVGGFEGSKPRQILISRQQWQEMQMSDKE
jgi:S-DNA-T family DNA segregation ATPase FtsK/SpoIIIE